jgi:hypothetical protein
MEHERVRLSADELAALLRMECELADVDTSWLDRTRAARWKGPALSPSTAALLAVVAGTVLLATFTFSLPLALVAFLAMTWSTTKAVDALRSPRPATTSGAGVGDWAAFYREHHGSV